MSKKRQEGNIMGRPMQAPLEFRPMHPTSLFDPATQWSAAMSLPSKIQTEEINCATAIGFVPVEHLTEENIEDKVASIKALVGEGAQDRGWDIDPADVAIKLNFLRHGTLSISASVTRPGYVEDE